MKTYNSIDVMKFILAILVICIHTNPLQDVMPLINYGICQFLARIAVPLFFMASGFFLFLKMDFCKLDVLRIKKYILHVFRLYIIWSIIYIPLIYEDVMLKSSNINYNIASEINNIIMGGSYLHLWFLKALVSASILSAVFLLFKISKKNIIKVLIFLYAIALIEHSYYGIYKYVINDYEVISILISEWSNVIVTCRDGICFGAIFFFLGACISQNVKKNKMSIKYTKYMIISWLGLLVEAIMVKAVGLIRVPDVYIMLIPTAYYTFIYILNIRLEDSKLYFYLRKQSMFIFYTHALFIYICRQYFIQIGHLGVFVFSVLASIAVSHIMIKFNNNIIIKKIS